MGAGPVPARPVALRAAVAAAVALAVALAVPGAASAADPGRWRLAKASPVPLAYNQGLTATASGAFTFTSNTGLFATTRTLRERRVVAVAIPPDVQAAEGYDHIGDPTYDRAEGGRLLLPLECYSIERGNHCGTGAIGVADPATLRWRYYVKLDPRDIKKAMWAEVSPDGRSLWTQSGSVLLRYAMRDVRRANAAPTGKLLRPVQRLRGALPPGQMTGAAFSGRRMLVATQPGPMQVWSIDLRTGKRRLEIERRIRGESEGLAVTRALGGTLHWLVAPFDPEGRPPTYGPGRGVLLTFRRRR
jgi:hypothetical protein